MVEPLPCPFCGEPPDMDSRSVYCTNCECPAEDCQAYSRPGETLEQVVGRWNTRFDPRENGCCSCKHAISRHNSLGCVDCDCGLRGE
jgi:hypothetical protein